MSERFTIEDDSPGLLAAQQKGRGVVGAVRVPLTAIHGLGQKQPSTSWRFARLSAAPRAYWTSEERSTARNTTVALWPPRPKLLLIALPLT
jgi:hypothetical protein